MRVRGVAGKHHPSVAVGRRLAGSVRPCGREPEGGQGDVGAGDPAQNNLHVLHRDRLCAVEGAAIEVDHRDRAGLRVGVHARPGIGASDAERLRVCQFHLDRVAGEFGIGAGEFEAASLAHGAAPAIAAH
ncbi:hypothetical protein BN961_03940 [Afipia felis]|uniref:Uncharacterized protein n=1 Tax=Afipia felis TaxID=1035 RepID=A0A090MT24_AFIFE|nr:hypothetical protein BN961_03940 [Afipia felis]